MKKNKELWLGLGLIWLPVLYALITFAKLPAQLDVHFGLNQASNGQVEKLLFVLGFPLAMSALHALIYVSSLKKEIVNPTFRKIERLMIPVISSILYLSLLLKNLYTDFPVVKISGFLVGLILFFVGNYLPKQVQEDRKSAPRWMGYGFIIFGLLFVILALFVV